ncbi:MAG: DUF262 domain-containing protein [Bacteroidales bacterium]|nr:DUF262 domain-containing protein [Bacteroidales bacterium]
MEYTIKEQTIQSLYELIKTNMIDLRPSYQRNFIWGKKDQQSLVDSILRGWPLPTFFLYRRSNGRYEMVDGQQRAETICRFIKGDITDSKKQRFENIDKQFFLSYRINVTEITNVDEAGGEKISEFYALVNKRGLHLNPAEVNKAQYAEHPFMRLVENLLNTNEISNLDIFTDKTINRMNDRTLIEELVAYLHGGLFDKRDLVNEIYQNNISTEKIQSLSETFMQTINRIGMLNEIFPIKDTRYKQRNDFFTLFTFIHEHFSDLSDELLIFQYGLLCWIDKEELIRPSNDDCELLQKYAFSCVTQSNSKNSRKTRLEIFDKLLLHKKNVLIEEYERFLEDLRDIYNIEDIPEREICGYSLIDYCKMEKSDNDE